ncbi:MAG: PrsW family intramembrane metalloprotease [Anaerolineales bacterium]|nr:PrsW family intramembrane metalloprotease [Anaerolineales bacterium]
MNTTKRETSLWDWGFLIFVIAGTFTTFIIAAVFAIAALFSVLGGDEEALPAAIWGMIAFAFLALCGIPGIYTGVLRLSSNEELGQARTTLFTAISILFFGTAIILGFVAYSLGVISLILGPLAQLLAATAAVLFIVQIARRNGPTITQRKTWGQFLIGLWLVPLIALVVEIILIVPVVLIIGFGALFSEGGQDITEWLLDPSSSVLELGDTLNSLVLEPWFILLVLIFFSFLVPLVEEVLKTMAVWPLIYRGCSSAEAFLGGVIGGAGYALFEAIFLFQEVDAWLPTMIGRGGATIMHAFTAGIASWGLAEGFNTKRWWRTVLAFVLAIGFHGLWNASAVAVAFSGLLSEDQAGSEIVTTLLQAGGVLLIGILIITAILGIPGWLRKVNQHSAALET